MSTKQELEEQVIALKLEITELNIKLLNVAEVASAINKAPCTHTAYMQPQWQIERAKEMAAAKAAAMQHHCVVKV